VANSAGNLIMLTGPSGVGKSTITEQLHQRLGGDWLLWQADRCQPRGRLLSAEQSANLTYAQALALEERMYAANISAISAYLSNDYPVVAELAVMSAAEADAVHKSSPGRTMLVQLTCTPETLAQHLQERDTPVPIKEAISFYERWRNVDLPDAVRIHVDNTTSAQVVDQILQRSTNSRS